MKRFTSRPAATLLGPIDLTIDGADKTVILGPNGAGKSLLLRLIHGLIEPTSGQIRWSGPSRPGREHAMVFQRPVMLRRSAAANIDQALSIQGLARAERLQRIAAVLERTGLTNRADYPARALSIGEQQRLALARAWALRPKILFLDEPTASLDPGATRAVEAIIEAIHQGDGETAPCKIVMTTHDLGQARRVADEIVFLHKGTIVERGSAGAVLEHPSSAEMSAFLNGDLLW